MQLPAFLVGDASMFVCLLHGGNNAIKKDPIYVTQMALKKGWVMQNSCLFKSFECPNNKIAVITITDGQLGLNLCVIHMGLFQEHPSACVPEAIVIKFK